MQVDLAILGAGAAGLIAAIAAQQSAATATGLANPLRIALLEKNRQPGIKLLVCGGGRCNFTNAGSVDCLIQQFGRNGRFLTPALRHLDNAGLREFFVGLDVPSHEEHDGKIYPDSNSARSVVDALVRRAMELGITMICSAAVQSIESIPHSAFRISHSAGVLTAQAVVLATGGMSYQRMGTTGDGYRFAEALGHSIVTPRPAIVGLLTQEAWPRTLAGTAVQDVEVRIDVPGPLPRLATGKPTPSVNDLLLTHFGLSGPAVLNLSEIAAELLEKFPTVSLRVDLVRHMTHEQLAGHLRAWQQQDGRKQVKTMLAAGAREVTIAATSPDQTWSDPRLTGRREGVALPARLAEKLLELTGIPAGQICAQLTVAHVHRLVELLKALRFTITGTRGFKEAMVTAGGITLTEVDPRSLESKLAPNLFVTGEVLDLTGPSGGYNLQLAFSTGHLAGAVAGERLGQRRRKGAATSELPIQ